MGWRGKLVCLLIFFFAGFATAIYCIAPVPEQQKAFYASKGFPYTAAKSDHFAKSFNVALHKFLDFSAAAASRTADYLKQKSDEKPKGPVAPPAQSAGLNR